MQLIDNKRLFWSRCTRQTMSNHEDNQANKNEVIVSFRHKQILPKAVLVRKNSC